MISSPIYGAKKEERTDGLISGDFSVRYYGCSGTSTSTNQNADRQTVYMWIARFVVTAAAR